MNLTLNFDSQARAHADFMAGVTAAAAILNSAIVNPINVRIDVGYGEVGGTPISATGAEGGPGTVTLISYAALRSDLAARASATNLTLTQALASLPVATSIQGKSQFFVTEAQAQIFGLDPATISAPGGSIGIGSSISGNDVIGVALHELTHALGRTDDRITEPGVQGLFRFTAAGTHGFASSASSTYFSLDNGVTNIASYGVSSDDSDFLNTAATGNDAFNEFFTSGKITTHLTPLDLKQIAAIGFSIQAPVLSLATTPSTAAALGSAVSLASHPFQITDSIDPDGTYQATITATRGIALTSGQLGTISGNGSASLVLTGSLANVNADLALLSFTGTSAGTGTITVAVNDGIVAGTPQTLNIQIGPSALVTAIVPGRAPEIAFDASYYLAQNPDVKGSGADPQTHFDLFGWREGRNPDVLFDVTYYLATNPDIARAGIDPLLHYEQFGWKEGRNPSASFNTTAYLARNPDVALAGVNPLDHYLLSGVTEHRALA